MIKISGIYINDKLVPTVKLSDNPAKATGDPETVKKYAGIFNSKFFEQETRECKY